MSPVVLARPAISDRAAREAVTPPVPRIMTESKDIAVVLHGSPSVMRNLERYIETGAVKKFRRARIIPQQIAQRPWRIVRNIDGQTPAVIADSIP
jgi:hypothetical protein